MRLYNLAELKKKSYCTLLVILCFSFFGCKKKPVACFTISNENPAFAEIIKIDGSCSKESKWVDFFIDGEKINEGQMSATYTCYVPGQHTINMKAYSNFKGSLIKSFCTNCSGTGEISESSQVFFVPETINAESNSPLYYNTTLKLKTPLIRGATYYWSGPNNFTSNEWEPQIFNVTAGAQGVYTVVATIGNSISAKGTTSVTLLSPTPICSPPNNYCYFTGGLSTTSFNNIYSYNNNGYFELHANSNSVEIYFRFQGSNLPYSGIYTLSGDYFDMKANEVYMQIQPANFLENPFGYPGVVYITNNTGKITATYCDIPFSYLQYNFTTTGKVVQP